MGNWSVGEVLGFDFETTGVDRFNDVPVSYALVRVVAGDLVSTSSGLVDPGREIPAEAMEVHGISTERARAEGISLREAIELVSEAVISAGERGVPLVGMKLDFDLTILDRFRKGRRTLGALCAHYGVDIGHAHDACADAVASARVLCALAARFKDLDEADPHVLHQAQIGWHREWAESYDEWRSGNGVAPMDRRDFVWPVAPEVLPVP
jgi:DNA polymerase III subunit epsilon